jgi:DNA-binding transcriptional LysR family regulator
MLDWNDLRYFLAVARTGSTMAAARVLGVNQTTVARRIGEMEKAVGAPLFERSRDGYRLREDAGALMEAAERIEAEAQTFVDLGAALERGLDRIRVTTNEPLANAVLAPAIAAFRAKFPEVRIEIVISPRVLDLARGEADMALRAAPLAEDSDLVARKVGDASWGVYCSRDYARFHGAPQALEALAGHVVLMVEDPGGGHIASQAPNAKGLESRASLNDLCIAARAGLGVVSLPCVLGESLGDLMRCFVQPEPATTPIWLIYHPRLRKAPELRALLDHVADQAVAARDILRPA